MNMVSNSIWDNFPCCEYVKRIHNCKCFHSIRNNFDFEEEKMFKKPFRIFFFSKLTSKWQKYILQKYLKPNLTKVFITRHEISFLSLDYRQNTPMYYLFCSLFLELLNKKRRHFRYLSLIAKKTYYAVGLLIILLENGQIISHELSTQEK